MVSIGRIMQDKIGFKGIHALRTSVKGARMLELPSGKVLGIMIQASFSDAKAVPPSIRTVKPENHISHTKWNQKNKTGDGIQIMRGEENTSLRSLLYQTQELGYELVDASHQVRIKRSVHSSFYLNKRSGMGVSYHAVRFVFIHRSEATVSSQEFLKKKARILGEMEIMFKVATWAVDVFDNPCSIEGAEGCRFLSINPKARQPLFYPNGSPIEIWEKDTDGNKTDKKVRLQPNFSLRLVDGEFNLEKY